MYYDTYIIFRNWHWDPLLNRMDKLGNIYKVYQLENSIKFYILSIKNKLFLYYGPIICDMQNVNIYIMCDKTLVLLLCTHTAAQWAM